MENIYEYMNHWKLEEFLNKKVCMKISRAKIFRGLSYPQGFLGEPILPNLILL